jgi:outer membrane protein TolC
MGSMYRNRVSFAGGILAFLIASGFTGPSVAQQAPPNGAVVISLSDAIHRAQQNEPGFASALAAEKSAAIDRYLAKAALLPSVVAHNQMLYTQPNGRINRNVQAGAQASPIFIANNVVHEYVSQASINETVGLKQFADALHHKDRG